MKIFYTLLALLFTSGNLFASASSAEPKEITITLRVINEDVTLGSHSLMSFSTANAVDNQASVLSDSGKVPAPGNERTLKITGPIPHTMALTFVYNPDLPYASPSITGERESISCSFEGGDYSSYLKPNLEKSKNFVATIKKAENKAGRVCEIKSSGLVKRAR